MVGVEIFLSPFLKVLFDQLTPHARELWNLARNRGLEKKLEKLVQLFRSIEAVLADAEEQQMTKQAVKLWLDDLRDLAYDAEDVMDEFSTEALRLKVMEKQQATTCRFTPCALKFKYKMGSKIDAIVTRLKEISERKDQLSLVANIGGSSESTLTWKPTPTTSTPIEAVVYGRDEDKKNIIHILLNEDQNCNVIPIVAMGGAGKTTLAQHVYEDEAVAHAFQSQAWVCVSTDFDVIRIMKAVLVDLTSQPCDLKELQPIQEKLKVALNEKRLLIVLDDIWDHTFVYDKWLSIESLLRIGAPGSKMIVTTRQKEVAEKMGSTEPYMLKLLSDDDCWRLFKTHAFKKREDGLHPNLESIRKKIVERCDGLPLAARALGGLLRSKSSDSWEEMLNNKIWSSPEVRGGVLTVLKLSYYYLPPQLKKCFAYCAIFHPNYEFTEEELVLLWIGEGLIQQIEGRKQLIHEGHLYFSELVSRSLFQASSGNSSRFIMHDLVDELAKQVGGEIYVQLDDVEEFNENQERIKKVRHCSYLRRGYDTSKRFEFLHKAECMRTFRVSPHLPGGYCCYIPNSVLHVLFRSSKLRVLSFNGYAITELPDSIGNLKYLRCLDLSSTKIKYLPKSTCSLYNLQILSLRNCKSLRELPSKMENLINLCYLDITNADRLQEMPIGLKELKILQVLSNFIVAKSNGCGLKELENFKDLSGNLSLSNLENVVDAGEVMKASLNEKKNLEVLVLKWGSGLGDSRNVETETCVLDMLQPNQNLKELTIIGYGGNAFSTWLGDPLFSSMKMLKLEDCKLCTCLPPLGQLPSLKTLEIKGMHGVKSVGAEFYGNSHSKAFPSLESLSFEDMPKWENWSGFDVNEQADGFSCLSVLSISYCPKLSGNLPNHLPLLEELVVDRCENLSVVISNFPKVYELDIDGCLELISKSIPNTIESLTIKHCLAPGRFLTTLFSLTFLTKLVMVDCSSFQSLPSALFLLPLLEIVDLNDLPNLRIAIDEVNDSSVTLGSWLTTTNKKLIINHCRPLVCISTRGGLPASLRHLVIRNCPRLEFVTETFLENTKLEWIKIDDCENFQRLAEGMWLLDHLKHIEIIRCPNLLSFPEGGLGSNKLEKLEISECKKLEALPDGIGNMTSLRRLDIRFCEGIKFVGGDDEGLFTNLKELIIMGECPEMEGIPMKLPIHLVDLRISDCREMTRMPNIPITLTRLRISDCPKLTTLPSNLSTSSSLINLNITNCEEMTTLPNPPLSLSLDCISLGVES